MRRPLCFDTPHAHTVEAAHPTPPARRTAVKWTPEAAPALAQQTTQNAVINRVLQSDADRGQRRISFCARPTDAAGGGPGHAFVLFQHCAKDGKQVEFLAVGHGPVGQK